MNAKQHSGNLFLYFLGADYDRRSAAHRLRTSAASARSRRAARRRKQAATYVKNVEQVVPEGQNVNDGFFYNYWNAAWALVQGLNEVERPVGAVAAGGLAADAQAGLPGREQGHPEARQPSAGDPGSVPAPDREGPTASRTELRRGLRRRTSTRRSAATSARTSRRRAATTRRARRRSCPWQGKIQVVKNGVITKQYIK